MIPFEDLRRAKWFSRTRMTKKTHRRADLNIFVAPTNNYDHSQPGLPLEMVNAVIRSWPVTSQQLALQLIEAYGVPNKVTAAKLVWYDRGPLRRTVVHRDTVQSDYLPKH